MKKQKQPIKINPYQFQSNFQSHFKSIKNGKYFLVDTLQIHLKSKILKASHGTSWKLLLDGTLYLFEGFIWNGPDVVGDEMSKMLSSAVHDAINSKSARKSLSYLQRQGEYYNISRAQGCGFLDAGKDYIGLVCFNWAHNILDN